MKATETKLLEFLKKSPQFIIPIYQRTYSWTNKECRQLWDDIMRTGHDDAISSHFIGSIVYIEKGIYQVSSQSPLLVIDGQQRLTTVMLILEALARQLGDREPIDGFTAKKLRNYYLLNPLEEDERGFKLLLTQTDKQSLINLLCQKRLPLKASLRIRENFEFFQKQLEAVDNDLVPVCKGLAKLVMVDIALSRDQDNPQLIFESMNSTGLELSQADLIRNFVLMNLDPNHQTKLYEDHWRPMEIDFGQEAYGTHFDSFMRHYLTYKTGDIPNVKAVYTAFKEYARRSEIAERGIDALVTDVHRFASYYCAMAIDKETDRKLAAVFRNLRELKVDVAFPFLLNLYDDYANARLSRDDFVAVVHLTEAYVFRRAVCAIPTNSLNKTFITIGRDIKLDRYLESVEAHLLQLPTYKRFPTDEEFIRELSTRDLYTFPRRSYWLRRLENYGRKEPVLVDEYTIEHIMPQNEDLSAEWRKALGPDWQRVHETWLHTLGNLTLTGYNSEYSDHSFAQKRDMAGGFGESPLHLNKGLGSVKAWNEDEIKARAKRLAKLAVKVWERPELVAEMLEAYHPKVSRYTGYSLSDHPQLAPGSAIRSLFEEFRQAVLALDPGITEEILKLYIAYKAETNFVDVVPQKNRLRLSLNMPFHELNDPKGWSRDITNVGRWGNGDVGSD